MSEPTPIYSRFTLTIRLTDGSALTYPAIGFYEAYVLLTDYRYSGKRDIISVHIDREGEWDDMGFATGRNADGGIIRVSSEDMHITQEPPYHPTETFGRNALDVRPEAEPPNEAPA